MLSIIRLSVLWHAVHRGEAQEAIVEAWNVRLLHAGIDLCLRVSPYFMLEVVALPDGMAQQSMYR